MHGQKVLSTETGKDFDFSLLRELWDETLKPAALKVESRDQQGAPEGVSSGTEPRKMRKRLIPLTRF